MKTPLICLSGLALFALSACTSSNGTTQARSDIAHPTTASVAAVTSEAEPFAPGTKVSTLIAEQGQPDFVSKAGPRTHELLRRLEAEWILHFRFPDSTNLSFAVGVKDSRVTDTVVYADMGPSSMYVDTVDYYHARARGERIRWSPAGGWPSSVAASAPRTTAPRLGGAIEPGH